MASKSNGFECSECGFKYVKWVGKCGNCGNFNSLVEVADASPSKLVGLKTSVGGTTSHTKARKVKDIDPSAHSHIPTGIGEFDRVFSGGLVKGQVVLLAGEPGVGKSTLLLSVADEMGKTGRSVLVASGEESAEQIKIRADRLGVNSDNLYILDEPNLAIIVDQIEEIEPELVIVDSVQTIASPDVEGKIGGVSQVHEVASVLTRVAKNRGVTIIIVGQVNKDTSQIAGPQALAHIVDSVAHLNGDKNSPLRLLRIEKNRFGSSDEVACFAHENDGLKEVPDPSGMFIGSREEPVPGTCITVTMEGRRPLLAEVQALVSPTNSPNPRRGISGLDAPRSQMIVAVTEKHSNVRLYDKDIYLATVGGMKITEPAADMALALAIASAASNIPLPKDMCAIGEVTLSGDVRTVPSIQQRVAEAARLGFARILVPEGTKVPKNVTATLIPVGHVSKAISVLAASK